MTIDSILKGNQNTTKLIADLKKSASQYPCLSKEQEQKLIAKYHDNREELNRLLFMHNIKAVFNQAKHYMSSKLDFDTLVQDGMLGLAEACNRFDIDKGVKFITYAIPWIKKMILMHFYNKNKDVDEKSISLDIPTLSHTSKDENGDVTFENFVDDYVDPSQEMPKTIQHQLSSNESIGICKKLYNYMENDTSLSSTEKAIFVDAIYNKEKTRDIAEKYNIDMTDVNAIKHKILQKMKDILEKQFDIHSVYDIYAV